MTTADPMGTDDSAGFAAAPLETHRVRLRPLVPSDYDFAYHLSTNTAADLTRWRYRGATPSPEAFSQTLWNNVLAQFIVEQRHDGSPVGLVTGYNADHRHSRAYFAAQSRPDLIESGIVLEGVAVLLDYLFRTWPFRKLYIETLDFNFDQFASATTHFLEIEGRLKEWEYHDGRYWDMLIASISRSTWEKNRALVLPGTAEAEPT